MNIITGFPFKDILDTIKQNGEPYAFPFDKYLTYIMAKIHNTFNTELASNFIILDSDDYMYNGQLIGLLYEQYPNNSIYIYENEISCNTSIYSSIENTDLYMIRIDICVGVSNLFTKRQTYYKYYIIQLTPLDDTHDTKPARLIPLIQDDDTHDTKPARLIPHMEL